MNENKREYPSHRLSKAVENRLVKYLREIKGWNDTEILELVLFIIAE